jgi:hypothetical protein
MDESLVENQDRHVQVRFSLPKDVHKKVRSHQRKLSALQDSDVTMEQALIDFVRKAKVK